MTNTADLTLPARITPGSNAGLLIKAARNLNINWQFVNPHAPLKKDFLFKFWDDLHQYTYSNKGFNFNTLVSRRLSRDKYQTITVLAKHHLPTLPQIQIDTINHLNQCQTIPANWYPLVIKPTNGAEGKNVYLNIKSPDQIEPVLHHILKIKGPAVIQPYVQNSNDLRVLVLNHQVIGITERKPPTVTGDGQHTIQQLIDQENATRLRQKAAGVSRLRQITSLDQVQQKLAQSNLTLTSILPANRTITLLYLSNFSQGGFTTTYQHTDLHPSFITLSETISKVVDMKIVGIDFLVKDKHQPAEFDNCIVIETNSKPGLLLHSFPNFGKPQNVFEQVLKYGLSRTDIG